MDLDANDYFDPSISCHLCGFRVGGRQPKQRPLDLPIPSHFLQLIQGDTKSSSFVVLGMH